MSAQWEGCHEIYNQTEILEMLENANQGGLLTFQRGCEKLKGRSLDQDVLQEAARLYGTFFISFHQTASFLKVRFERAAVTVKQCLGSCSPIDHYQVADDTLRVG